jgi:hypothetical protein
VKIWRLTNPHDNAYAQCILRGAWALQHEGGSICPQCGTSAYRRAPPLILEWEQGSSVIGDFNWPDAGQSLAITRHAIDLLSGHFSGFSAGPVQMIEEPKLPTHMAKPAELPVRLPYHGPELCELWVDAMVRVDHQRSSIKQKLHCKTCGSTSYSVEGIETTKSRWNRMTMKLEPVKYPREPGKGLYIRQTELLERDIFRTQEFPSWILCTDNVKEFVVAQRFSNVSFLEYGETFR